MNRSASRLVANIWHNWHMLTVMCSMPTPAGQSQSVISTPLPPFKAALASCSYVHA